MEKIIEVTDLKKSYKSVQAVKGISFYVEAGKLFAFLGPNGAGKSTTIDMICTLLRPDSGSAVIDGLELGRDDSKIRSVIGAVFQDSILDPLLTVKENLIARASFYHLSNDQLKKGIERAAEATFIGDFINRPYGKLSGGQRRRADIARALVNTPKILFLDEPTTGLDPQTRVSVWEMIKDLQKESGTTIFLTTHYMEEAAGADYVIVIDDGLIAAKGTPDELRRRYSSDRLRMETTNREAVENILREMAVSYQSAGNVVTVQMDASLDALPMLTECREFISGFEVTGGSMDDAFIGITGKEMRG